MYEDGRIYESFKFSCIYKNYLITPDLLIIIKELSDNLVVDFFHGKVDLDYNI